MELRVLRYFLTVAREENISRAAESLFMTQPTLSRQIAELEQELGTKLFERGKRKITLTEEGILLRRRAEEIIDLEQKIESEFKQKSENLSGVVSIGAAETKAASLLPQAITNFRRKFPLVTFDIHSGIASEIKDGLDRGIIDLGLLVEPNDIDKFEMMKLGIADKCGILMSQKSHLAGKEFVTVDDLENLPVVANKRQSIRSFYRNKLGEKVDKLNVIATFNLINNAVHFAQQNLGYVFTIEGSLNQPLPENTCFKPFRPEISQQSFLVWKKYQPQSRVVQAFLDELRILYGHNE